MKRDSIVVVAISFLICLFSGKLGAWFSILFGVIALIILGRLFVKLLSDLADKSRETSKLAPVIDKVLARQKIELATVPSAVNRFVDTCYRKHQSDLLTVPQNTLKLCRQLRVLPQGFTGELPQYLGFVLEKKALYELQKKYGERHSMLLAAPKLSETELLRPLQDSEVEDFHSFCLKNQLLVLHNSQ